MFLSRQFLTALATGMGFTTGSLISLHLYTLIFNEENDEENDEEKEMEDTKLNIEEIEIEEDINFFCRVFRYFSRHNYEYLIL